MASASEMVLAQGVALLDTKVSPEEDAVTAAITNCAAVKTGAEQELSRLTAARSTLLVSGTDAEVERHDAAVAKVSRERDRAEAIVVRLRERLEVILVAAAVAQRDARRLEVEKLCADAIDALRKRYPKILSDVASILKAVASAQLAAESFAKTYPGEPPIADPESTARNPAVQPSKVLKETKVLRWAYRDGSPVPDQFCLVRQKQDGFGGLPRRDYLAEIKAGTYQGTGQFMSGGSSPHDVFPKWFIRREVRKPKRRNSQSPLASTLKLPGLMSSDITFDLRTSHTGPSSVLAELQKIEEHSKRSADDGMETVVEFVPSTDEVSAAAAA